jgi:hypothetical protein
LNDPNSDYHFTLDEDGNPDVSYRLVIALNLLHCTPVDTHPKRPRKRSKTSSSPSNEDHQPYKQFIDLVNGEIDNISTEIDIAVQESIRQMCKLIAEAADKAIQALSEIDGIDPLIGMLVQLWRSHSSIARALLKAKQA